MHFFVTSCSSEMVSSRPAIQLYDEWRQTSKLVDEVRADDKLLYIRQSCEKHN